MLFKKQLLIFCLVVSGISSTLCMEKGKDLAQTFAITREEENDTKKLDKVQVQCLIKELKMTSINDGPTRHELFSRVARTALSIQAHGNQQLGTRLNHALHNQTRRQATPNNLKFYMMQYEAIYKAIQLQRLHDSQNSV